MWIKWRHRVGNERPVDALPTPQAVAIKAVATYGRETSSLLVVCSSLNCFWMRQRRAADARFTGLNVAIRSQLFGGRTVPSTWTTIDILLCIWCLTSLRLLTAL